VDAEGGARVTGGRRALLLSGSLGMGHDVMAEACAASLRERAWRTETLDAMRLLGKGGRTAGESVFRGLLAVPGLYDAYHFAALRTGNRLAELTDAMARRNILPRLAGHLEAHPADLAVSVFATAASAVSRLDRPGMAHVVFCTDVTPHRLWVQPNVDLYMVTSRVAERAVYRFDPAARVAVVPAPVRAGFYSAPNQAVARAGLRLSPDEPCVLLMSGAWGLGPIAETAAALGDAGVQVLAVAGRNRRLAARLRAVAGRCKRVRPFGFTDRIPELMAAADLVITASGDTCGEARVVGRHLLLLDVVQGHGRDNLQHELELGDADVTSANPAEVARNARAALNRVKPPGQGPTRTPADWEHAFSTALAQIGLGP
jgi:UDP-N-acetylglucosamine:LPS N-acetylglucosamine transferase